MNDENTTDSVPGPQALFRGPKGDKGDKGVQGDQGEPGLGIDQTITVIVSSALKKAFRWQRRVIAILVVVILVLAANSGYLLYKNITHPFSNALASQLSAQQTQTKSLELYVQQYAQHGCQALELLASKPVPKPADPAKNPSRETTYEFYEAILYWEHADGCSLTVHQITPPVK
jgi:hypothetical protein